MELSWWRTSENVSFLRFKEHERDKYKIAEEKRLSLQIGCLVFRFFAEESADTLAVFRQDVKGQVS